MSLLPGYPLLNFAFCTGLYVLVSYRLFNLTNTLKNAAVPHSNDRLLLRNTVMLATVGGVLYLVCYCIVTLVKLVI